MTPKKATKDPLPTANKQKDECCHGTSPCKTTPAKGTAPKTKTRIVVKYDVGFENTLFLRGKGANLNWEKGVPLKNVKNDEWVWETDLPFSILEFKVLINDEQYESGDNHKAPPGAHVLYTPKF